VAVNETRVAVMSEWQKLSLKQGMSDMYWQQGVCGLSFGSSTNDTEEAKPLMYGHAEKVNAVT